MCIGNAKFYLESNLNTLRFRENNLLARATYEDSPLFHETGKMHSSFNPIRSNENHRWTWTVILFCTNHKEQDVENFVHSTYMKHVHVHFWSLKVVTNEKWGGLAVVSQDRTRFKLFTLRILKKSFQSPSWECPKTAQQTLVLFFEYNTVIVCIHDINIGLRHQQKKLIALFEYSTWPADFPDLL